MGNTQKYSMLRIITLLMLPCLLTMLVISSCLTAKGPEQTSSSVPVSFSKVVEQVMPSVVYIFVKKDKSGLSISSSGSGIILSDGYVLTNRHVVEDAQRVEVTMQDRYVYESGDILVDDVLDLAVLRVEAQNLPTATFGDPARVKVGDWAIALGHPIGLSPETGGATVTVGVISNIGRSFLLDGIPYYDIIQTDAAINPGNSGGPLVNLQGEVIGINSAEAKQAQNISYAINAGTARRVFDDLVQYGKVRRAYLGATLDDITPAMACEFCLTQRIGAALISVQPGGSADLAGLQQNDVIVRFGREEIKSAAQVIKELWKYEVGETVSVIFWRGETEMETTVTIVERSG